MEKARHGTVAERLKHSAELVNGVQEDMLATRETINARLKDSELCNGYESTQRSTGAKQPNMLYHTSDGRAANTV